MAEEILYQWEHATDLVLEVQGAVLEGERPTQHPLWGILADPTIVARHSFSLLDADGNRVTFPLKLVSDTHIMQGDEAQRLVEWSAEKQQRSQ